KRREAGETAKMLVGDVTLLSQDRLLHAGISPYSRAVATESGAPITGHQFDVAVLGGGVAGCAAALAAAANDARTCMIAGTPGATAMFSGAWRGGCPDGLRGALAAVGYDLRAMATRLPHPTGAVVNVDSATPSHSAARLDEDAVVVGFAGLAGFEPAALALQWSARADVRISAHQVTFDETPATGWAPASLAAFIERNPQRLVAALEKYKGTRMILPAVLGASHSNSVHAELSAAVGPIGEALALPPSLPGWRLHSALRLALADAGVTIVEQRTRPAAASGHHRNEIALVNDDVVRARAFVLATGKFAAGGIDANGALREPAFDCPIWVDHLGEHFEQADALMLTDAARNEDQPLLRAGVHTDGRHRPVNRAGDVVYDNVFVAGSIRSGWTAATHGAGDAAQDGWSAGLEAARA
ncbi:MAG: FAD-binding protein, partial [Gemmatimonadota bacterium]